MTMPNERTRALRWGREALNQILDDPGLGASLTARARDLLRTYPEPAIVLGWIADDVKCIPAAAAEAIEGAGELLRLAQASGSCSADLDRSLRFTLRHFPQAGEARGWTREQAWGSLANWLFPEDLYDQAR